MIPVTVATWYITSSEPRMRWGADSAMNTGATTTETPMVRPSSSRATISDGTLQASPLSSENSAKVAATPTITGLRPSRLANVPPSSAPAISPITTAVVTRPWVSAVSPNSGVRKSSAPAMLDES